MTMKKLLESLDRIGGDTVTEYNRPDSLTEADNPWEEGYHAGFSRKGDNRYPVGSQESEDWEAGYAEGMKDKEDAMQSDMNEAKESNQIQIGDNIHLGFRGPGGAGFEGTVIKIDNDTVYIQNDSGQKYKGPLSSATPAGYNPQTFQPGDVVKIEKGQTAIVVASRPKSNILLVKTDDGLLKRTALSKAKLVDKRNSEYDTRPAESSDDYEVTEGFEPGYEQGDLVRLEDGSIASVVAVREKSNLVVVKTEDGSLKVQSLDSISRSDEYDDFNTYSDEYDMAESSYRISESLAKQITSGELSIADILTYSIPGVKQADIDYIQERYDRISSENNLDPIKDFSKIDEAIISEINSKNQKAGTNEGYTVVRPIDRERYTELPGLEGPFQTKSGKVVYYDPKEGRYYDRDSDMYLSHEEWDALNEKESGSMASAKKKAKHFVKKGMSTKKAADGCDLNPSKLVDESLIDESNDFGQTLPEKIIDVIRRHTNTPNGTIDSDSMKRVIRLIKANRYEQASILALQKYASPGDAIQITDDHFTDIVDEIEGISIADMDESAAPPLAQNAKPTSTPSTSVDDDDDDDDSDLDKIEDAAKKNPSIDADLRRLKAAAGIK